MANPLGWSYDNTSDIPNQGLVGKVAGVPDVDAGKQGKHVAGHPNSDPAKSQWATGVDHITETQNAWLNGIYYSSRPGHEIKLYDAGKIVGANGETLIRVIKDKAGHIHGYPVF